MSDNVIFITGHKNPDTDSICSAIGYAALKGEGYAAGRAGELNPETQFVLLRRNCCGMWQAVKLFWWTTMKQDRQWMELPMQKS